MGKHDHKYVPGFTIHMLEFIEHAPNRKSPSGKNLQFVRLKCLNCGSVVERDRWAWLSERQKSCGCYLEENRHLCRMTHGMVGTPIYSAWLSMRGRTKPGNAQNKGNYIGVKVDPRWATFEGFLANPPTTGRRFRKGLHLARFGDVGDYTPENTRWLTISENSREASRRRMIRLPDGRFAADVARENGIKQKTWWQRKDQGFDIETAVTAKSLRGVSRGHQRTA